MPVNPANRQAIRKRFQTLVFLFKRHFIACQTGFLNPLARDGIIPLLWRICMPLHFCHTAVASQR
jgi:hypothetical protein